MKAGGASGLVAPRGANGRAAKNVASCSMMYGTLVCSRYVHSFASKSSRPDLYASVVVGPGEGARGSWEESWGDAAQRSPS